MYIFYWIESIRMYRSLKFIGVVHTFNTLVYVVFLVKCLL